MMFFNKRRCLIFILLFLNSFVLNLQESIKINEIYSNQYENITSFLKRSGRYFESLTNTYNFEFCSRIWTRRDRSQYALIVTTLKSHIACNIGAVQFSPNDEWIPLGLTIHTHPNLNYVQANEEDVILKGGSYKLGELIQIDPNTFSNQDYTSGPGFLIVHNELLFQNGYNTAKDLGSL